MHLRIDPAPAYFPRELAVVDKPVCCSLNINPSADFITWLGESTYNTPLIVLLRQRRTSEHRRHISQAEVSVGKPSSSTGLLCWGAE